MNSNEGRTVERKFLLDRPIRLDEIVSSKTIEEAYLPRSGSLEIRIRLEDGEPSLTIDTPGSLEHPRWETPIDRQKYDDLWPRTLGRRVRWTRTSYRSEGTLVDVDAYEDEYAGLCVAVVSFPTIEAARAFGVPPQWGPEITWDTRYKNANLAADSAKAALLPGCSPEAAYSVGAIPFRRTRQGDEIVVVSTRRKDRWIFPKGQLEPRKTFQEIALQEADEEAGVRGELVGHPVLIPYYRESGTMNLWLYPLRIARLLDVWLESTQRERLILPPAEIGTLNPQSLLGPGLEALRLRFGIGER